MSEPENSKNPPKPMSANVAFLNGCFKFLLIACAIFAFAFFGCLLLAVGTVACW